MPVLPHTKEQPVIKQFAFDGEWLPDIDPSKIGENNFALLRNFRYDDGGIAPVEGYSKITDTSMNATYLYPKAAVQVESTVSGDFVVAVAEDTNGTAARIYVRTGALTDTTDFTATAIYTPNTNWATHRLAVLPRGCGYANEYESVVYEGQPSLVGGVLLCTSSSGLTPSDPINFTNQARNDYDDSTNVVVFDTNHDVIIVGVTRPADSMDFVIKDPNLTAGSTSCYVWTSSGWIALTVTDGTKSGTNPFAQSGTISWSENTESTTTPHALPGYMEGMYLYWYKFTATGADADITSIKVNIPMQKIKDVWDGVYRTCVGHQVQISAGGTVQDFLLEVNEPSNVDFSIASRIGTLQSAGSGWIDVCFEEQTAGIFFEMIGSLENTNASVPTVYYWNGSGYVSVGTVYDGTADGGAVFGKSGVMYWMPTPTGTEKIVTKQGVTGYWYRIYVSATLSGGDQEGILIDIISGVPAPRTMNGHRFPATYGQRSFWCADVYGNEANAMDYGPPNTVDVYNGAQSSARGQRIYVGDGAALTASTSIYNRFGSSIYETMLIFKNTSTHLMYGTGPHDYKLYTISNQYGCPAPRTIAAAEVGYQMSGGASRNVAIWMSYRGPVIFDGAVILPLQGVDIYFDPRKTSTYINTDVIESFHGWFDPFWKEYHLLLATGSSTTLNVHIVYDLHRKRWFEIKYDAGDSAYPQVAFTGRDAKGFTQQIGILNDGYAYQLESGNDWDGTDITHKVRTADFFIAGQEIPGSIWIQSRVMDLRIGHEVPDFEADAGNTGFVIAINYYGDGAATAVALDSFVISKQDHVNDVNLLAEDSETIDDESGEPLQYEAVEQYRYTVKTQAINKVALTHQFEFSRTSDSAGFVGNFGKNPLWWGFLAKPEGLDTR